MKDAYEWMETITDYQELWKLHSRASTQWMVRDKWQQYAKKFPKHFIELFDPQGLKSIYGS